MQKTIFLLLGAADDWKYNLMYVLEENQTIFIREVYPVLYKSRLISNQGLIEPIITYQGAEGVNQKGSFLSVMTILSTAPPPPFKQIVSRQYGTLFEIISGEMSECQGLLFVKLFRPLSYILIQEKGSRCWCGVGGGSSLTDKKQLFSGFR